MTEAQIAGAIGQAMRRFSEAATEFSAAFVQRVIRDEETGELIRNDAMHNEWHALADYYDRLIVMAYPEAGKSASLIIGRALWSIGKDPSKRIVVVSRTYGQAEKIVRTMRQMIDHSEDLRQVFPMLRPGPKWTDGQFTIKRPYISKTPSVQAIGFRGAITGARVDELYVDDLEDDENTRTPARRADTLRWVETTLLNRLTRRGRVVWTTNAWHPQDVAHTLGRRSRWHLVRYPVERDGKPTFPRRYPPERLAELRADLPPLRYAQVYLNDAREESAGEFQPDMIEVAREAGRGVGFVERLDAHGHGALVCTGVDLATGRGKVGSRTGDLTVLATVLCYPDKRRQILRLESGRWTGPEILSRLCHVYDRFGGAVIVEDNGAQLYLHQFAESLRHDGMEMPPIHQWSTGKNKWDPAFGVASIAVEMARGQWIFPCTESYPGCPASELRGPDELEALVQEMLDFAPDGRHTGDRLMALWFAREGIRRALGGRAARPPSPDGFRRLEARGGGF